MAKVKAHEIKLALSKKHENDFFQTEVKTGATWGEQKMFIIDAFAMQKSWASPCFTAYEIKTSRADFLSDSKWHNYVNYCHRFSFVCPKGVIDKNELPEEVGLIYYYPETKSLKTIKRPVHRFIKINADLLYYIILSRLENEKHPFFSNKREMLEAWVEDRIKTKDLGWRVNVKFKKELQDLTYQVDNLERKVKSLEDDAERYYRILKILRDNGINVYVWNVEEVIKGLLKSGVPNGFRQSVDKAFNEIQKVKMMLDKLEENNENNENSGI